MEVAKKNERKVNERKKVTKMGVVLFIYTRVGLLIFFIF